MTKVAVLAVFAAFALAASASAADLDSFNSGIVTSLKYCLQAKDKMDCLKRKVIKKIDAEMRGNRTLQVTEEVILSRDPSWSEENSVSRSLKSNDLNEILWAKVNDFIKSSVVQFKLGGEAEEGRRKKGHRVYMYAAIGMAGVLAHIFFGKLALVSGLALLTAKVALMLSVIVGLKKLVSSNSGHSEHVVYTTSDHGHGGWQRSTVAQDMAYRGYKVKPSAESAYPSSYYGVYEDPRGEIEAH